MKLKVEGQLTAERLTEYDEVVVLMMTYGFYSLSKTAAEYLIPITNEITNKAIAKMMEGK